MLPGPHPRHRRRALVATALPLVLAVLAALAGCGAGSHAPQASPLAVQGGSPASPDGSSGTVGDLPAPLLAGGPSCVDTVLARLGPRRYGQLVMAGVPAAGLGSASTAALTRGAGGIIVTDGAGVPSRTVIATVTAAQRLAGTTPELLVSTDQEGGQVQELDGAGFSTIPAAVEQGRDPGPLRSAARRWGAELRTARVNVDLAPVADVVDPALGTANAPVGRFGRQYGTDAGTAGAGVAQFVGGMQAAGVAATLKHFPGLGKVRQNTDFAGGVVDSTTTADDADLQPFRDGIAARAPLVMMSSARYTRIDGADLALFSPTIMNDVLRGKLGFPGVIMTDDVGAAAALADIPVGDRAVRFLAAGGDLVLTVRPADVPPMLQAIGERAERDEAFRARADDAVRRVLVLKQAQGLACR